MKADADRQGLDRVGLLACLPPATRDALSARCAWRAYGAGELILSPGSTSRDVLFVVQGRVRVVTYAASGREVAFAVLEAGAHVGEPSALEGEPRSASVEALEALRVAAVPPGGVPGLLL